MQADYLEPNWQEALWGANYPRLQQVKARYDPGGLFRCHHCVELPGGAAASQPPLVRAPTALRAGGSVQQVQPSSFGQLRQAVLCS